MRGGAQPTQTPGVEVAASEENALTQKLYGKILQDITARQRWEGRQTTWYNMRNDGLRRTNKPWAHAADLHFPLADTIIGKFLPFYFHQIFGTEVPAQFVPKLPEVAPFADKVAYWFNFKLRQESNLEREAIVLIDKMLMAGFGPMKVYWDADAGPKGSKGRLAFDAIQPIHCIVPESTSDLQRADRVTLVHHYSRDGYLRDSRFTRRGEEFLKRITGRPDTTDGGSVQLREAKDLREGITHTAPSDEIIIIWEVWEQTAEDGWWTHWFSPLAAGEPVRASQRNPLRHGLLPIVRFDMEATDKAHYSSRGVPEKVGAFETYGCKVWNEKSDAMTLYNRPIYTSENPLPNAGNIRLYPGQIVPGIKAVSTPNRPPISFDEELDKTRAVAEALMQVPDFGIGDSRAQEGQDPTATEVRAVTAQSQTAVELRGRTFRMALAELFQLAWETLLQYDADTKYYVGAQMLTLPETVLKTDAWKVLPNGTGDSWNKPAQMQKAVVLFQMFGPNQIVGPQGDPFINQMELRKSVLEMDDPRLVSRFLQDPQGGQQAEYERESALIPAMLLGAHFTPKPTDDAESRIRALVDFHTMQDQMGNVLPPVAINTMHQRLQALMQVLQQNNPKRAQALQMELQQRAQNVIQMPPGAGPVAQTPDASGAAAPASAPMAQ